MARNKALDNFYCSKKWIDFRRVMILERGLICQECNRHFKRASDITLHHEKELTIDNYTNYDIAYNPDNIKVICKDCHNKIHNRYGHNEKNVYIVYGAPFSGKEEYVQDRIMRGDIVCNIERIFENISMQSRYDKPNNLFINVMSIYNLIIDNIKTRYGKWNNAYIIATLPDRYKRELLQKDTGGELIYIERTKEECMETMYERITDEALRKEYMCYIVNWFNEYTPPSD